MTDEDQNPEPSSYSTASAMVRARLRQARAEAEAEMDTWPCNDCGLDCLKGDELCGPCYEKQRRAVYCFPILGDTLANLGLSEDDFR